MKCRDIPDRADDYVDRRGPVRHRLRMTLHLAACADCRGYVRGLERTRRLIAESFRTDAAAAVVARLGLDGRPGAAGEEAPR